VSFKPFSVSKERVVPGHESLGVSEVLLSPRAEVKDFELEGLSSGHTQNYQDTRAKYGSLAITEREKRVPSARSFRVSELIADALHVREQELKTLENEVQLRLKKTELDVRQEAEKLGFKEGFEAGKKEGLAEAQKEQAQFAQQMSYLLTNFENAQSIVYAAQERFLVELALSIGKFVTLKSLQEDPGFLERLLSQLIKSMDAKEHITIRVAPQDYESVERLKQFTQVTFPEYRHIRFELSNDIALGGVTIESDWRDVDARIETQLAVIRDILVDTADAVFKEAQNGS
jgi:flagellar assembly protein FliH